MIIYVYQCAQSYSSYYMTNNVRSQYTNIKHLSLGLLDFLSQQPIGWSAKLESSYDRYKLLMTFEASSQTELQEKYPELFI